MHPKWQLDFKKCMETHNGCHTTLRVPQEMIKKLGERDFPVASSKFLGLPVEVIIMILKDLNTIDKLHLALSCRKMLSFCTMEPITIPSAEKHIRRRIDCHAAFDIIRLMAPRLGDRKWGHCHACHRYRPKKTEYWLHKQDESSDPGLAANYDLVVREWCGNRSTPILCPECWLLNQSAMTFRFPRFPQAGKEV
ncbi:hypothetical protein CP533_0841 [Ophiocordyceps camponoti-saundersi (nom. inval.)]|nr:hypothetical protein CP533_0841 [Ophiocordyceps camponoti-saundersi (nom. inval.)]